jgi:mono/diheme cytochrome c family protein
MRVRSHTVIAGLAAIALAGAVHTRSSGQAAAPAAKPSQAPSARTTPRPATPGATAGTTASARGTAPKPVTPAAPAVPATPDLVQFRAVTGALFDETCGQCHNDFEFAGNFDISPYYEPATLTTDRDTWEKIYAKVKSGEMPPKDVEKPVAQLNALATFLEAEFDRQDALQTPDPGRVTARRLNRSEYTNTIRDLLAIDFRADRNFPTDDSGEGFDNIGDILTVSPVLMEKYLAAAATIAERAIANKPLPKPVEVEYSLRYQNLRRLNPSNVEATHRIDFDAEYDLRIGLPGQRAADAAPVTLGIWVDGKLVRTTTVETKPSGLVYFNPYSEEQVRLSLPQGDHTFRLGFIGDDFVKTLASTDIYKDTVNKWIGTITIIGPFASKTPSPSRGKVFTCDLKAGAVCVDQIISTLARRAYRRPVTRAEVASLTKFVALAKADGLSTEDGIGLALQAILVSPNFLFHIERDPNPTDPTAVHRISDVELASRLSYFLWNSMPDETLLSLAERKQLGTPAVLDAQVKRMLADPKSSAMAENFAGQWLEIRNLDSIKPDPQKFPAWGPELRDALKTETRMFFDEILRENRPINEFLNARYTYLNEFLAKYYGIDGVTGPDFRRVDLTTPQRGGVLGQGSVLAVSSYPTRTSVVIRGKYILQNILGTPPPPPPANVPALDDSAVGTAASLRQQMEKHRSNPVCASCHSRMDPLGFALENYDAIGRWRTQDGNFPVDSSGVLPSGKSFSNPAEMREVLSGMLPDFARCLTEKVMTYALGRGLQRYDRPTVNGITKRLAASGYGFQTLVEEVVHSLPFQSRRGEALPKAAQTQTARAAR